MWSACPAFLATTFRYGFHMSLHTNASAAVRSFPNQRKNWSRVLARRGWADPEQFARDVDLVDQGEKVRVVLPVDFIAACSTTFRNPSFPPWSRSCDVNLLVG